MKSGEEDNERRNGKQQCGNVSVLAESVVKRQKEDKEEKKTPPYLCTIHAKCVITIPRMYRWHAILMEKSTVNYWDWGGQQPPADETTIVTFEHNIITLDDEINGQQPRRRKDDFTMQMNSMLSI